MQIKSAQKTDRSLKLIFGIVLFTAALTLRSVPLSHAAPYVADRFDVVSDSAPGATSTHRIGFTFLDLATPIGSVRFEFCSNDALPESPCTPPTGLDASAASLQAQTGEGGFTLHPNSNANNLVLSRAPAAPASAASSYTFGNITNPTDEGTYFVRIQTFGSIDGTGTAVEAGGIALATVVPFSVSTEVPPYLRFCAGVTITDFDCASATSFFIDLGEFSTRQPTAATSQLVAATNAEFGYSISLSGTTLTSGNNLIPNMVSAAPSSPGNSQFGINLRANGNPAVGAEPTGPGTAAAASGYNTPNLFKFVPGETVASGTTSQNNRKFTVSYLTNISSSQPGGIYATTVSYICLANF